MIIDCVAKKFGKLGEIFELHIKTRRSDYYNYGYDVNNPYSGYPPPPAYIPDYMTHHMTPYHPIPTPPFYQPGQPPVSTPVLTPRSVMKFNTSGI